MVSTSPVTVTRGARVRVTGTLGRLVALDGQSVGLHVQSRSLAVLPSGN